MYERFDDKAIEGVLLAQEQAFKLGKTAVEAEHLLFGLAATRGGVASKVLKCFGVDLDLLQSRLAKDGVISKAGDGAQPTELPLSDQAETVLDLAWSSAQSMKQRSIGTHNLLIGLVDEHTSQAAKILSQLGIDPGELKERTIKLAKEMERREAVPAATASPLFELLSQMLLFATAEPLDHQVNAEYLRIVAPLLSKALGVSRLLILSRDAADSRMHSREWWDTNVPLNCRELGWPKEDSVILKTILLASDPVVISQNQLDPINLIMQSEMELLGAKSLLGVSFRHQATSYGCLILQHCLSSKTWNSEEITQFQRSGDIVGSRIAAKYGDGMP